MNKKTLYITFDGLTDPLGQSQILPYLLGVATNGFEITILSCEKPDRLRSEKKNILQLIKNTNITWHYILYSEKGGSISRFLYLKKLNALAFQLHKQNKFQLIHCRSYIASLIGLLFKQKKNVPFIFDMRGFWADERIDGVFGKKIKSYTIIFISILKKRRGNLFYTQMQSCR